MNLINKILILLIILVIVNHLTDNKLFQHLMQGHIQQAFQSILGLFNKTKESFLGLTYTDSRGIFSTTPVVPFAGQLDFQYNAGYTDRDLNEDSYKLYNFFDSMIVPNVDAFSMSRSNNIPISADKELTNDILRNLEKKFNMREYFFSDFKLLEDLYYINTPKGKEIVPFKFTTEYKYNNRYMGTLTIYVEMFIFYDKFYYRLYNPNQINILNIKLIDQQNNMYRKRPKKIRSVYKIRNDENINDLFIQSSNQDQQQEFIGAGTDNSLIPSTIELSNDYATTTQTATST